MSTSSASRIPTLGPRGEGWLLLQLALIVAIVLSAMSFTVPVADAIRALAMWAGLIVLVVGLGSFGLGVVTLGSSLSPLPAPLDSADLIERGIYRFIRHPIYTGLIVAATGGSIYAISPLALLFTVALAVVLDLKSRREEIWLRQKYAGYADYAQSNQEVRARALLRVGVVGLDRQRADRRPLARARGGGPPLHVGVGHLNAAVEERVEGVAVDPLLLRRGSTPIRRSWSRWSISVRRAAAYASSRMAAVARVAAPWSSVGRMPSRSVDEERQRAAP